MKWCITIRILSDAPVFWYYKWSLTSWRKSERIYYFPFMSRKYVTICAQLDMNGSSCLLCWCHVCWDWCSRLFLQRTSCIGIVYTLDIRIAICSITRPACRAALHLPDDIDKLLHLFHNAKYTNSLLENITFLLGTLNIRSEILFVICASFYTVMSN